MKTLIYKGTLTAGKTDYFIPDLYRAEELFFFVNNIEYSVKYITMEELFNIPSNIRSLPYKYSIEQKLRGSTIIFRYNPIENYNFKIVGKFI